MGSKVSRTQRCAVDVSPLSVAEEKTSCGILVLLVRHVDLRSRALVTFTRGVYSHASLGFEDDPETYYSFAYRGFCIEQADFLVRRTPDAWCRVYRIPCSAEQERRARSIVSSFCGRKESLKYNAIGLVLACLHIPLARRNRFYCSQFVALVLNRACGIGSKRWARACLPDGLSSVRPSELLFDGLAQNLPKAFSSGAKLWKLSPTI